MQIARFAKIGRPEGLHYIIDVAISCYELPHSLPNSIF